MAQKHDPQAYIDELGRKNRLLKAAKQTAVEAALAPNGSVNILEDSSRRSDSKIPQPKVTRSVSRTRNSSPQQLLSMEAALASDSDAYTSNGASSVGAPSSRSASASKKPKKWNMDSTVYLATATGSKVAIGSSSRSSESLGGVVDDDGASAVEHQVGGNPASASPRSAAAASIANVEQPAAAGKGQTNPTMRRSREATREGGGGEKASGRAGSRSAPLTRGRPPAAPTSLPSFRLQQQQAGAVASLAGVEPSSTEPLLADLQAGVPRSARGGGGALDSSMALPVYHTVGQLNTTLNMSQGQQEQQTASIAPFLAALKTKSRSQRSLSSSRLSIGGETPPAPHTAAAAVRSPSSSLPVPAPLHVAAGRENEPPRSSYSTQPQKQQQQQAQASTPTATAAAAVSAQVVLLPEEAAAGRYSGVSDSEDSQGSPTSVEPGFAGSALRFARSRRSSRSSMAEEPPSTGGNGTPTAAGAAASQDSQGPTHGSAASGAGIAALQGGGGRRAAVVKLVSRDSAGSGSLDSPVTVAPLPAATPTGTDGEGMTSMLDDTFLIPPPPPPPLPPHAAVHGQPAEAEEEEAVTLRPHVFHHEPPTSAGGTRVPPGSPMKAMLRPGTGSRRNLLLQESTSPTLNGTMADQQGGGSLHGSMLGLPAGIASEPLMQQTSPFQPPVLTRARSESSFRLLQSILPPSASIAMPRGGTLTVRVGSTWGDASMVSVGGLHVFGAQGQVVQVALRKTIAVDVSSTGESVRHELTLPAMMEGSTAAAPAWTGPWSPSRLCIELTWSLPHTDTALSAVRLWNYSKSRVHASRGARHVCVLVDGQVVHEGELGPWGDRTEQGVLAASTTSSSASSPYSPRGPKVGGCVQQVLFTHDEAVVASIQTVDIPVPVLGQPSPGAGSHLDTVGFNGALDGSLELRRQSLSLPSRPPTAEHSPSKAALAHAQGHGDPLSQTFPVSSDEIARALQLDGTLVAPMALDHTQQELHAASAGQPSLLSDSFSTDQNGSARGPGGATSYDGAVESAYSHAHGHTQASAFAVGLSDSALDRAAAHLSHGSVGGLDPTGRQAVLHGYGDEVQEGVINLEDVYEAMLGSAGAGGASGGESMAEAGFALTGYPSHPGSDTGVAPGQGGPEQGGGGGMGGVDDLDALMDELALGHAGGEEYDVRSAMHGESLAFHTPGKPSKHAHTADLDAEVYADGGHGGEPPALGSPPQELTSMARELASPDRRPGAAGRTWGRLGMLLPLHSLPQGRYLTLRLLSTWGDPHYIGLTGIQVHVAVPVQGGQAGKVGVVRAMKLPPQSVFAQPSDLNELMLAEAAAAGLPLHELDLDPRTADNLVDGVAVTTDDTHMWLAPFTPPAGWLPPEGSSKVSGCHYPGALTHAAALASHVLQIDLGKPHFIAGIKVHNYNKSPEDIFRGVRHLVLEVDGHVVRLGREAVQQGVVPAMPGCTASATVGAGWSNQGQVSYPVLMLRPAPGSGSWDYGQCIDLCVSADERDGSGVVQVVGYGQDSTQQAGQGGPAVEVVAGPVETVQAILPLLSCVRPTRPLRATQDWEAAFLPTGSLIRLVLPYTCGDVHYIGLDAVAFYDARGRRVRIPPWAIHVSRPSSINDMPAGTGRSSGKGGRGAQGQGGDARVPSNLAWAGWAAHGVKIATEDTTGSTLTGGYSSGEIPADSEAAWREDDPDLYTPGYAAASFLPFPASRAWLAPYNPADPDAPGGPVQGGAEIIIALDYPVSLSLIRLFNYSKTPSRGTGAVELWLDGLCIFSGAVAPAQSAGGGATRSSSGPLGSAYAQSSTALVPRPCSSIAFTTDPALIGTDVAAKSFCYSGGREQEVVCWDEGQLVSGGIMTTGRSKQGAGANMVRPSTAVHA